MDNCLYGAVRIESPDRLICHLLSVYGDYLKDPDPPGMIGN
jgi:hypothetical protein